MNDITKSTLLERYQQLIDISRDLASTLDLDTLLNRIVRVAADLSLAEETSILLYDDVKNELRLQAATNLAYPNIRGLRIPVTESVAGWIVTHSKPIIIGDMKKDGRKLNHISKESTCPAKSLLGVPLIYKGKVIGVLEAINKKIGNFSIEDQELLLTLGSQAAVAIQNTRFFAQSDLISEFVHELRTPLASLNTAANLLLREEIASNKRNDLVEVIQHETSRLSSLATAFLDIARLESGRSQFHIKKVDLFILLNECASLMQTQANEAGLALNVLLPKNIPTIQGDSNKLKQAILNLLSNAIKYNQPEGEIILTTENKSNTVRIIVKDNGIGIPKAYIDNLFTKFYRVPGSDQYAQGTGLGLVIVKRIIEGHGGDIAVSSKQGAGTIFTITLPMTPE